MTFFQTRLQKTKNYSIFNIPYAQIDDMPDINTKNHPELPENDLVMITLNLRTTAFIFDIGKNLFIAQNLICSFKSIRLIVKFL